MSFLPVQYGAMTLFGGKHDLWTKRADSVWRSLTVWGDAGETWVYLDGAKIRTKGPMLAPNTLTVESRAPKAGRQTALSVANVHAINTARPRLRIFGEYGSVPFFTHPDIWLGGYYELAIELGPRSDARLLGALTAIWGLPEVDGPYERRDVEPEEQPRVEPTVEAVDFGHMQGVVELPGSERIACGTTAVREEDGPDWLLLYIPMGALERVVDVGAFPIGGGPSTEGWRVPLDEWLARVGQRVFEIEPFQLALVGHEVSGSAYASELLEKGVPGERWIGYLWRESGELRWYPPTRW